MQELRRDAMDVPMSSDDLMRVIALEDFHSRIRVRSCIFSYISPDEEDQARERLSELRLQPRDLDTALRKLPLPLHLCGILFQASRLGVGYEAAAIVALKHAGRWPHKATFTVPGVIAAVSSDCCTDAPISRLQKVRALFGTLVEGMPLNPTRWNESYTEERLAVAFLTAPERLIWNIAHAGAFLGTHLVHECKDSEYFVAALFSKPSYADLKCALHLPFSSWVQGRTGIRPPTQTFKLIGDSTFQEFRRAVCQHLRKQFMFDVRCWSCRGGASETALADDLIRSPKTDSTVMCPNGNRMRGYDQMREPGWLQQNAKDICGGLRETSTSAVLFVGDPALSPGVEHPEVYAALIGVYLNAFERLGVPVITKAPGVELQVDRIHWSASSTPAVLELMTILVKQSLPTQEFLVCPPAAQWHWIYLPHDEKHFPYCRRCNKMATDIHLGSTYHIKVCGRNLAGFAIQDRQQLCEEGHKFHGSDGRQIQESPLPPDRPLQVMTVAEIEDPPIANSVRYFEIMEVLSSGGPEYCHG